MAPYRKQRKIELPVDSESDSDENNESNETSDGEMEMIEVDFDVKIPDHVDFHGIKNLLHQLFLKAHINTSELAELLIKQKSITGIIKQAEDDEDMEIEDPDDLDVNFGVFSVINLTEQKNMESVNQIHTYLLSHCKKTSSDENFQVFKRILEDTNRHVGLIISERMVNIPPRIALPLYSGLGDDITQAKAKGEAFDFEHFLLICKIVIFNEGTSKESIVYTNGEEEIIAELASMSFDFSVSSELDSGLSGEWEDDDCIGHRKRRVLILPASSWDALCNRLSTELAAT